MFPDRAPKEHCRKISYYSHVLDKLTSRVIGMRSKSCAELTRLSMLCSMMPISRILAHGNQIANCLRDYRDDDRRGYRVDCLGEAATSRATARYERQTAIQALVDLALWAFIAFNGIYRATARCAIGQG